MPLIISSPSIAPSFVEQNPPLERKTFFDYFRNTCTKYPGYIKKETFKNIIELIIKDAVHSVGRFTDRYWTEPNQNTSWSKKGIDRQRESARQQYIQDIKDRILAGILSKEWRPINEMNASKEMYEQSMNYFTTVGTDIAMLGVEKVGDKIINTGRKIAGKATAKAITSGQISQTTAKKAPVALTRYASSFLGKEAGKIGFLEVVSDFANATVNAVSNPPQRQKFKTIDYSDMSDLLNFTLGYHLSEKELVVPNTLATGLDLITDYNKFFKYGKLVVKSGLNLALGLQTRATADRMKKMEDQSNEAEQTFNRNLRQTIYDDFNFLNINEIEGLIRLCGISEWAK